MILITGAAGFIGFHLTNKFLEKKFTVIGVDCFDSYYDVKLKKKRIYNLKKKKNFKFYRLDISEKNKLNKIFQNHKIEYVINLAAQAGVRYSLSNPDIYIKNNIIGFHNLIMASIKNNIKHFIYASTSSVYGLNKKMPFKEQDPVDHPLQLYAVTKRSNELMAHAYSYLYNLPTTGLRFFTVYGPWGRPDMALFKFTKNIILGKKIEVFNYGNHIRDFTYVTDIVEAIYLLLKKLPKKNTTNKLKPNLSSSPFQILNIGNSKPVKLMSYIREIEKCTNKKAKIKYKTLQKGDVKMTYADSNLLYKKIKFKPKIRISEGVANFVKWYKSFYKI
jgi:UDP-glucuronate 4-epimerase